MVMILMSDENGRTRYLIQNFTRHYFFFLQDIYGKEGHILYRMTLSQALTVVLSIFSTSTQSWNVASRTKLTSHGHGQRSMNAVFRGRL
jgi:hypothetical protein